MLIGGTCLAQERKDTTCSRRIELTLASGQNIEN